MSFFRKPPFFSRGMEVKTQLELEVAKSPRFFFADFKQCQGAQSFKIVFLMIIGGMTRA